MPPEAHRLPGGTLARPEVLDLAQDLLEEVWTCYPDVVAADRMGIATAVGEIVANVVEHSGQPVPPRDVEVDLSVAVGPDRVEVVIADTGDPVQVDLGAVTMPDDEEAENGRGLALTRLVADEVAYEREDGWNRWRVVRLRGR